MNLINILVRPISQLTTIEKCFAIIKLLNIEPDSSILNWVSKVEMDLHYFFSSRGDFDEINPDDTDKISEVLFNSIEEYLKNN